MLFGEDGKYTPNTFFTFIVIIFSFTAVISLGMTFYVNDLLFTELINVDVDVGPVNFGEVASQVLTPLQQAIHSSSDVIIFISLISLCIAMMAIGYVNRKSNAIMIIAEFFILIIVLATSMLFSYVFGVFIGTEVPVDNQNYNPIAFFQNVLPMSVQFVIDLPVYVLVTGLCVILVSYVLNRRKTQEEEHSTGLGFGSGGGQSNVDLFKMVEKDNEIKRNGVSSGVTDK